MVPRAFVDITSAPRACLIGDLMGFLEDLEKALPRAWRSYRNAFESVECARHADYTEERVLLACIEMNEYISGEFTRVPACASIYIYILLSPHASICNACTLQDREEGCLWGC